MCTSYSDSKRLTQGYTQLGGACQSLSTLILHWVEALIEHAEHHRKLHVAFLESWPIPLSESSRAPTRNYPR